MDNRLFKNKTKTTKPFKMLDCTRKKFLLLPAPALKVWLCHYMMERDNRASWPKLETICKELNMSEKTVKKQRRALLLHGWLKRTGEKQGKDNGKFKIPVMTVKEGTIPEGDFYPPVEHETPRVKVTLRKRGKGYPLDPGYMLPTEVYQENQVDIKKQVDGFAKPLSKEKEDTRQEARKRVNMPEGKVYPAVEPEVPAGPFDGMTESQIVNLLPYVEGMKLWRKYDQGDYKAHRAALIADVLEYQSTVTA